jgi:hypothetical protein
VATVPERGARAWSVVFWVTAVATALPIFATRYLPFTDLPEHIAASATLGRLMPGGGGAPYELALGSSQYVLYHAVGGLLARVVGDAILADKLLFGVVAVLWPVATRSLLRALGRDERLAIFAAMVFWNRATIVGLAPYIASVPLALFALALVVRQVQAPTARRGVALALVATAVFYTHASSYLLFGVTATALTVALTVRGRSRPTRMIETLVALVPSAVAALVWWRAGSLEAGGAQPGGIERMALAETVGSMPMWTFDIWRSHVDELCAGAWWLSYAVLVVASWRKSAGEASTTRDPIGPLVWIPFACAAAIYMTTPFRIGGAGLLNVRLAPVLTLFALLGLALRKDRLATVPLAVAACAALVTAGNAAFEMRRVEREKLGAFDDLLGAMRPGTSVAMLNFERSSPRTYFWPYVFAGSYHRARVGGVASYSFVELPHWPMHYARGSAPPDHGPFWQLRPCAYRYREDGAFYDYVLVQGTVDVFGERREGSGPPFVPIAHAGAFTLYEKVAGRDESAPESPDHGPCRPPLASF